MGRVHRSFLPGNRIYACSNCRAHLTNHEDIVSKSFQGRTGRAYLFNTVVNITLGPIEDRILTTGLHKVTLPPVGTLYTLWTMHIARYNRRPRAVWSLRLSNNLLCVEYWEQNNMHTTHTKLHKWKFSFVHANAFVARGAHACAIDPRAFWLMYTCDMCILLQRVYLGRWMHRCVPGFCDLILLPHLPVLPLALPFPPFPSLSISRFLFISISLSTPLSLLFCWSFFLSLSLGSYLPLFLALSRSLWMLQVQDIYCNCCDLYLGWKYEEASEQSQKVGFSCVTWLIHACKWLLHVCGYEEASEQSRKVGFSCVTRLIHACQDSFMCARTHSCVCQDSFMCVSTHRHPSKAEQFWSFMYDMTHSRVTRLIHESMYEEVSEQSQNIWFLTSDMTHRCVTWLIHVWHISFIYAYTKRCTTKVQRWVLIYVWCDSFTYVCARGIGTKLKNKLFYLRWIHVGGYSKMDG